MSYFWNNEVANAPKITVLLWSPVGHFESSFGHISVVVTKFGQDKSYSLSPKGCDVRNFSQYINKQSFRDGYAFKLNISNEQASKIENWMTMNFVQDGNHSACKYNIFSNNCVAPLQAAFLYAGIQIGRSEKLPINFAYALWKNGMVEQSLKVSGCVNREYPFWSAMLFFKKRPWDENLTQSNIINCAVH